MSVRIRQSKPADAARLYEVWSSAVDATHDFLRTEDRAEIAALVRERYLPSADLDIAVDANDTPLAFMGMTGNEIDSLFVHADARGQGIGRLLVEHALRRGPVVRVEVNEENTQGVAFWRHMGFEQTARSETDRQGRGYPLLLMEWTRSS